MTDLVKKAKQRLPQIERGKNWKKEAGNALPTGGERIHATKLTKDHLKGHLNYHLKKINKIIPLRNTLLDIHIEDCSLNEMKPLHNQLQSKRKGSLEYMHLEQ